jgi:hypothetical protein
MTDKDVERVAEAILTDDAATRASLRFLRQRYAQSKCDSEAVADCVRCNVMFLVRRFEDALSATFTSTYAVADIAKLGTVSLTSFDDHCVRIDFPNREDAERMYAVLTKGSE